MSAATESATGASHAQLLELINASWTTQAIRTACELRVPEALAAGAADARPSPPTRAATRRRCNACCGRWPRSVCVKSTTAGATR
jgi:hypothetical protein